jgi:hypothetical protein
MKSDQPVRIFAPEQIESFHTVFAVVCGRMGISIGDPEAEDVAVKIVKLASTGIRDVGGLTTATLAELYKDNLVEVDCETAVGLD